MLSAHQPDVALLMSPEKYTINLAKPPQKVNAVLALHSNLFVALFTHMESGASELHMFDEAGRHLHTHPLSSRTSVCATMDGFEVFYLLPLENAWGIFNTCTRQERKGAYDFIRKSLVEAKLIMFPGSNCLAITEKGNYSHANGRITYIKYPTKDTAELQIEYRAEISNMYPRTLAQLDHYGKLIIFQERTYNTTQIQWDVIDLRTHTTKIYTTDKPTQPFPKIHVQFIAEMMDGHFLLVISNINDLGGKQKHMCLKYNPDNNEYLFNPIPIVNKICPHQIFVLHELLVIVETSTNDRADTEPSPMLFVSLKTGALVYKVMCMAGIHNLTFLGNPLTNQVVRVEAQVENPTAIKITMQLVNTHKELQVHLMKERSHNRMQHDLIQYVLDAFDDTDVYRDDSERKAIVE